MSRSAQSRLAIVNDRELHLTCWGEAGRPGLLMVHGLTRNGRDFDAIAAALADRYHIVCPDVLGRGLSQWAATPDQEYCLTNYAALMTGLVDQMGWTRFGWIGTSMGGLIGMKAATGPLAGRISRLVLNDVGPEINPAAIERIKSYAAAPPSFARLSELEALFRMIFGPFGHLSEAEWQRLLMSSHRRTADGKFTMNYDPAIMGAFAHHPEDLELWPIYDAIDASHTRVLLTRGAKSDLLMESTAKAMTERGPRCRWVDIPDCGHAPMYNQADQIDIVAGFLA